VEYPIAHQFAETIENACVRASGIDMDEYVTRCDQWIDWLGEQPLIRSPQGLILYPYEDSEATDVMTEIVKTGGPESEMNLPAGVKGGSSGNPFNE
jgi:hypothetical protein